MVTTWENPIVITHKNTIKKSKHWYLKMSKHKKVSEGWETRNNGSTKHEEHNKMAIVRPYLSIIPLDVNGLNCPVKRQNGWMDLKKHKRSNNKLPTREIHFNLKDTHKMRVKQWNKTFQANGSYKKSTDRCIRQNRL